MEQQKADYVEQMQEAKEHEKTFEKSKKELQEQYGVADDSQEQKDLELLENSRIIRTAHMMKALQRKTLTG